MMPEQIELTAPIPATIATVATKTQPEPLRAAVPPADTYPIDALGAVLGGAAKALHEVVKAPLALCAQSVLAAASFAAQAHFDVTLPWGGKRPLSLFLLTVAESGERKSSTDDVVLGAAKMQERSDMTGYRFKLDAYENALRDWKAACEISSKKAAKAKTQGAADDAANAQHEAGPKPKGPVMPLSFVTDPTVEGLYKLLTVSQPSVALFSDEGGLLIGGHALSSDNALKTMARWCKFWDGSPFDRVRAGDGSGCLYGRRMALHQLAQPEVMQTLLGDRMANGQGFLARCLVAWPESTIGNRELTRFERPEDRPEIKRLFAVLKTLAETPPPVNPLDEQELEPVELPLSADAQAMTLNAVNAFERLMRDGEALCELRDRASKAVENACRIAGVLAVIERGVDVRVIDACQLERGLLLVQWYLGEALRLRATAVIPQAVLDAESLSSWLGERGHKVFCRRLILRTGPNPLRNKQRLDGAIGELLGAGYIVANDPGATVDGQKVRLSWTVLHEVF